MGRSIVDTTTRNGGLRQLLQDRRLELGKDVRGRIRNGRADRLRDGGDDIDHSDAHAQDELELVLLQMRVDTLTRIDEAIRRIDTGEYGSCFECEAPIAEGRLRAQPFAVRCRACEDTREQAKGRSDRRAGAVIFHHDQVAP